MKELSFFHNSISILSRSSIINIVYSKSQYIENIGMCSGVCMRHQARPKLLSTKRTNHFKYLPSQIRFLSILRFAVTVYPSLFTSTPTSPSHRCTTLPPLLARPIPHHALPRRQIALAQKRRNIHVQRRVWLRIRQELVDGGERGRKRVDGTPVLCREEGQTNLAGREGDVWMGYPRREVDCRWCEGVV